MFFVVWTDCYFKTEVCYTCWFNKTDLVDVYHKNPITIKNLVRLTKQSNWNGHFDETTKCFPLKTDGSIEVTIRYRKMYRAIFKQTVGIYIHEI